MMQTVQERSDLNFRILRDWGEGDSPRRVVIITTHPIQYNAPLFRFLASDERLRVKVFYTWGQSKVGLKYDPEFKQKIDWDIPLLEGYEYEFVKNNSSKPGSHHFLGIINPGLTKKIKTWQPDIVIVYGWNFYSHLSLMHRLKGKILVGFRGDSHLIGRKPGVKQWLKSKVQRWVYKQVDLAYFVGKNNEAYFRKAGLTTQQLVFVPHAVDNSRFMADAEAKDLRAREWKKELGIRENEVVFLYAGKFVMRKNLFLLIQAFKKMNLPDTRLIITGSGILEKLLVSLADGDPRIIFMGFQNQSEIPILYRLADVFVLPSRIETWGLAVNEAMACGCAIITSNLVGCAPDLVKNNENGFVVGVDQDNHLVEAMKKLASDRKFLESCKKTSLEMIDHWSIEEAYKTMADQICSIPVAHASPVSTSKKSESVTA